MVFDGKPDIFHCVLPVRPVAAALFTLPGDAVDDGEPLFDDALHGRRAFPVAAHIECTVGCEFVADLVEPTSQVLLVVGRVHACEFPAVKVLVEIVGRVDNDQMEVPVRNQVQAVKQVGVDNPVVGKRFAQVVGLENE